MAIGEKYLFYDNRAAGERHESLLEGKPVWLWSDRLLLIEYENDDKHWYFTALDLVTNETRPVYFPKSNSIFRRVKIVSLNKDYGFVVERSDDSFCVNLVKLMWAPGEFQLVQQLGQSHQFSGILVDKLSPTKFVLRQIDGDNFIYQACSLNSGKVEFGDDVYESMTCYAQYFNNMLYGMDKNFWIGIYDLPMNEEECLFQAADTLPNVEIDLWCVEWVKERLYAAVYFDDTKTYEIGYVDLKTLNWNFLDLSTDLSIYKIQYFDGSLIVYGNNYEDYYDDIDCFKFKTYSVPVSRPRSLRKMAWPIVVQRFKRDKSIDDSYKAAAKFLPFNSDLRPPWYKEEAALEDLREPESNEQSRDQDRDDASKLNQESSDCVPSKRVKFN